MSSDFEDAITIKQLVGGTIYAIVRVIFAFRDNYNEPQLIKHYNCYIDDIVKLSMTNDGAEKYADYLSSERIKEIYNTASDPIYAIKRLLISKELVNDDPVFDRLGIDRKHPDNFPEDISLKDVLALMKAYDIRFYRVVALKDVL